MIKHLANLTKTTVKTLHLYCNYCLANEKTNPGTEITNEPVIRFCPYPANIEECIMQVRKIRSPIVFIYKTCLLAMNVSMTKRLDFQRTHHCISLSIPPPLLPNISDFKCFHNILIAKL